MNDGMVNFQSLYEGDLFSVHRIEEDGEVQYSITIFDTVTIHLDAEEWNEFLEVMNSLPAEG